MTDVVHAKIVHDESIPITVSQFCRHMAGHIVVYFGEILEKVLSKVHVKAEDCRLTDTKKLEVPSERAKVFGKSFNHVSSPYMTSVPEALCFICASHVS